jgi:hypothetical protein
VTNQPFYGVVVETDAGSPGYIDSEFIADVPLGRDEWPAVGARLRAMVLAGTRRLALSARESDLVLVDSVHDICTVVREWQAVKVGIESPAVRERFYRSAAALPMLRWANSRLPGTANRELAQELLCHAPAALRAELRLE